MGLFTVKVGVSTGDGDSAIKREIDIPQIETFADIGLLKDWELDEPRAVYFLNESIRIRGQDAARLALKKDVNADEAALIKAVKGRYAKEGRQAGVSRGVTDMQILQFVAKLAKQQPDKFNEPLQKLQAAFAEPEKAVEVFATVRKALSAAGITTEAIKATLEAK